MTYEEAFPTINAEIEKRRYKWQLKAIAWMDYDDVAQIIRLHIYNKWSSYDDTKPLAPWVGRIVHNQTYNILRNRYTTVIPPCNRCVCALPDDSCEIYGKRDNSCPLYKNWFYNKKNARDINMPLPLSHHFLEVDSYHDEIHDLEGEVEKMHLLMKKELSDKEWVVYKAIYVDGKNNDPKIVEPLPQKYRQIQTYKSKFFAIAKSIINEKY